MLRTAIGRIGVLLCVISLGLTQDTASGNSQEDDYLSWTMEQATKIGKSMRASGSVSGSAGFRVFDTDRAISYKIRATWLTPEVIRATARVEQLRHRLSDEQTRSLVSEAEADAHTVFLIEIDPNEGSGVIPLSWAVFLQPKGLKYGSQGTIEGVKLPQLRRVKALAGVVLRDYSYDIFWVTFPLLNEKGEFIFDPTVQEIELVIGIYEKEGRVKWRIPSSIHKRVIQLQKR